MDLVLGVYDDDYEFIEITHEDLGFARYKLTEKKVKVVKSKTDKFKIICVILFAQKIAIGFFPCINYFFLSFHVITHLDADIWVSDACYQNCGLPFFLKSLTNISLFIHGKDETFVIIFLIAFKFLEILLNLHILGFS